MILRLCGPRDFDEIFGIINDGARAYEGVLPADVWSDPYMSRDELEHEIDDGVVFWAAEEQGSMLGVMGLQNVKDVTLIRHAYVRTNAQKKGIGGTLLSRLLKLADRPVLIGTWADATWAIRFYENNGFHVVDSVEKDRLLRLYWNVPERQIETSVVLARPGS